MIHSPELDTASSTEQTVWLLAGQSVVTAPTPRNVCSVFQHPISFAKATISNDNRIIRGCFPICQRQERMPVYKQKCPCSWELWVMCAGSLGILLTAQQETAQGSMLNLAKGLKNPTTLLLHPLRQDLVALVYKHKDRSFSNMRQGPNGIIPAKPIIVWLLCKVSKTSWQVSQPCF